MTEIKLLDCPFCGQVDGMESTSIHIETDKVIDAEWFWIKCDSCGAQGPESRSDDGAIAGWNREPLHYAEEELAPCPQCAGTGRWYKTEEQKQAETEMPPYWCDVHGLKGHTANSPMCEKMTRDDLIGGEHAPS